MHQLRSSPRASAGFRCYQRPWNPSEAPAYDGVNAIVKEDNLAVRLGSLPRSSSGPPFHRGTLRLLQGRHIKLLNILCRALERRETMRSARPSTIAVTNTRFADKNRIVLGESAQNLNGTASLRRDQPRIERLASKIGHVTTVLLQGAQTAARPEKLRSSCEARCRPPQQR